MKTTDNESAYFGVTLLDIEPYGAQLIAKRIDSSSSESRLYFDEAQVQYDYDHRALTVEGTAYSLSNPDFAIKSLMSYATFAREMDQLAEPFAS